MDFCFRISFRCGRRPTAHRWRLEDPSHFRRLEDSSRFRGLDDSTRFRNRVSSKPLYALYYVDRSARTPPLFALIIGINKYKYSPHLQLRGAVPDAEAVKGYLEETLGVLPSQIKTLYDTQATRAAIIQELHAFQTDHRIQRGNPIFIFFAGHGTTGAAPAGWEAGGARIQMLVPHDYLCENDGHIVHGIPDRTIGSLLEQIAKAKGDNIVRLVFVSQMLYSSKAM